MSIDRRKFIQLGTLTGTVSLLGAMAHTPAKSGYSGIDAKILPMPTPISDDEKRQRIANAQTLLKANKMDLLLLDAGISMYYFTGISWWPSERSMLALIPAEGEPFYLCPAFEESRLRESIIAGKKVLAWEEDENPFSLLANTIRGMKFPNKKIAIEEKTRFFISDGMRRVLPDFEFSSADPVTIPCRLIKTPAEIQLMQQANTITLSAIKYASSQLKEGMTQRELSELIMSKQNSLGGNAEFALCLFAESSSYPHGSKNPKELKRGDVVLMDCGCSVMGYNSDITRTIIFDSDPSPLQRKVWDIEKEAQEAAFITAQIGNSCAQVDAAARRVIEKAGYGPGYKLPGLPHRTGHGIGLEGHEWGNIVKGNSQPLQAGMCFSIEPSIILPGEFGIRLEDCVYMTESGPRWFSATSKSIDTPFD